ncbi:unnamed protein product [Angiostrongylus costaricensis]|uniref:PE-PGRS family protein n=1 Tax=Angiostrongylus costaricensis TaxID=334426 RepID=A0A0R3PM53_ANGCS|nr:unnamed protein product [Angiostrongylus costaricensis]
MIRTRGEFCRSSLAFAHRPAAVGMWARLRRGVAAGRRLTRRIVLGCWTAKWRSGGGAGGGGGGGFDSNGTGGPVVVIFKGANNGGGDGNGGDFDGDSDCRRDGRSVGDIRYAYDGGGGGSRDVVGGWCACR